MTTQTELKIKMLERFIERAAFCPDCRDKLNGKCYRCCVQTLEFGLNKIQEMARDELNRLKLSPADAGVLGQIEAYARYALEKK